MQKVSLYRYEDKNGTVIITPNKRNETDTPSRMRLIADENCTLINGITEIEAIDVTLDEVDMWTEINAETEVAEASNYEKIIDILSGEGE